jgi:TIR domain
MKKPTIFFSHSSRDKASLVRLKDLFCLKTGGSINVFLSSDGQSIPLGRNWVHRVQEAMEQAAIMVAFITPNAIRSSWIYFESGFAYAKGIRVVPVGFLGADLSLLPPPLSLLQGFNITSEDGLDNLIALANEEFSHSHSARFTADEYQELMSNSSRAESYPLGEYTPLIDEIHVSVTERDGLSYDPETALDKFKEILSNNNTEYFTEEKSVKTFGMSLSSTDGQHPKPLNIVLDPSMLYITLPLIKEILSSVMNNGIMGIPFRFDFLRAVECLTDSHKITARLWSTGFRLGAQNGFVYDDLAFSISHLISFRGPGNIQRGATCLSVTPQQNEISINSIRENRMRSPPSLLTGFFHHQHTTGVC